MTFKVRRMSVDGSRLPQRGVMRLSERSYCEMFLRMHNGGTVEIAFDNENGYIIVEVIAAKICRGVIDTDHKVRGGQRRAAEHGRGKALHAKFFAKSILCLSDTIDIQNQNITGHKIFRRQFTDLFRR